MQGQVTSSFTATTSAEAGTEAALQPLPAEGAPSEREQINLKCTIVNSIDKVCTKQQLVMRLPASLAWPLLVPQGFGFFSRGRVGKGWSVGWSWMRMPGRGG